MRNGHSKRLKDLTGKIYGRWTVLRKDFVNKTGTRWICQCACGSQMSLFGVNLQAGISIDCGCGRLDRLKNYKKGQSARPEYSNWKSMIYRCYRPDASHFYLYGGRGIEVCKQWQDDFWQFLKDVGPKPEQTYSLDRINTDGHYEPGNVRWATAVQQSNNRRPQPKRINFFTYQRRAKMTAVYPNQNEIMGIVYCALGMSSEVGEVLGRVKKIMRDNKGDLDSIAKADLIAEMGDVLWYLSQLASELEIDLSLVAQLNLQKLADRKKRGVIHGSGDKR